ncbi:MAG: reverse transcriptase-like protein [Anaerolinea sp.]|nr:reverse transcriptase-like protein [Anaerolinea sp.]
MSRRGGDLILYADGGLSPDHAGVGVVVIRARQIIALANRTLPVMTNNEAEYAGLLLALELAAKLAAERIEIRLDSEVVVGQMTGRSAVNSPKLKPVHTQACVLARGFVRVTYTRVPRERNALADALAAEAAAGRLWWSDCAERPPQEE